MADVDEVVKAEVALMLGRSLQTELDDSAMQHVVEALEMTVVDWLAQRPDGWTSGLKAFTRLVVSALATELLDRHGPGPVNYDQMRAATVDVFSRYHERCLEEVAGVDTGAFAQPAALNAAILGAEEGEPDSDGPGPRPGPLCTAFLAAFG